MHKPRGLGQRSFYTGATRRSRKVTIQNGRLRTHEYPRPVKPNPTFWYLTCSEGQSKGDGYTQKVVELVTSASSGDTPQFAFRIILNIL